MSTCVSNAPAASCCRKSCSTSSTSASTATGSKQYTLVTSVMRESASRLSTRRVSRFDSCTTICAYSRCPSGVLTRPETSVSPTARIAAIGVLSSCVTVETNSDRISARLALARTARALRTKPNASESAASAAIISVRSAPEMAAASVGSAAALTRTAHCAFGRSLGRSSATSSGSKKITGNRRTLVGLSGPAFCVRAMTRPCSSTTASASPDAAPPIRATWLVSSGK